MILRFLVEWSIWIEDGLREQLRYDAPSLPYLDVIGLSLAVAWAVWIVWRFALGGWLPRWIR